MSGEPKNASGAPEPLSQAIASMLEPIPRNILEWPLPQRLDAMLARLNAYDFLAALMLAESVLLDAPDHGLAAVCRAEAVAVLRSFLDRPLSVVRTDTAGLPDDAFTLLTSAEGAAPQALLPPGGLEHVRALRAFHDLVRLGYFEAREATFLESLNPPPSEPPLPRIDERANTAAVEELDRALALHPGETFGIGRCEELDFGALWDHPAHAGCKDIFPLAVGAPADMARREKHLARYARSSFPDRWVALAGSPSIADGTTHVLYVVIAPPLMQPHKV